MPGPQKYKLICLISLLFVLANGFVTCKMADGVMPGKETVEIKNNPKALWVIALEPTDPSSLEQVANTKLPPIAPVEKVSAAN